MSITEEQVFDALRVVEDPELGMDVVDLGLVYDVRVEEDKVTVTYSLTSMGCPAGAMIQEQMRDVVSSLEGVGEVVTDLTWTPPWSPEMMYFHSSNKILLKKLLIISNPKKPSSPSPANSLLQMRISAPNHSWRFYPKELIS